MGLVVGGKWYDSEEDLATNEEGRFIRKESQFRNWITADGSAGPTGAGGFEAEANRYHLYVSYACPWANRALIMRNLKGLEDAISVSVVNPYRDNKGWTFEQADGVIPDPVMNATYLYEIYVKADPNYSGRVSVPVLYDLKQDKIVNNESADIMRMLNAAFNHLGAKQGNYVPDELLEEIENINEEIYHAINNGVYKVGFATEQAVYEEEVHKLFDTLNQLEQRLGEQAYLVGDQITEADWRLFTTLIRFDSVYHGHFKCNIRKLAEYKNLWRYTKALYQVPGIAETINFSHIKEHYYRTHKKINPNGIVPVGPTLGLE
ncbi:putative glutathione S-transferase [Amphibacillus marinus]|uniref:Putative glutathione S-transferase n=1 Tax=Amphibacillus marinus TaxID=872970 RepID=A0A1H8S6E0_9BACI|nr:glutathione S-transferase family protein [Amphibacillus marinus]SEO74579.1 putative glutathione S-transferase [Amphibacillus marinus]